MQADQDAISNARLWLTDIRRMVGELRRASDGPEQCWGWRDSISDEITESALSVEVREGWKVPGGKADAEEYRVLLSTGGPALAIVGALDRNDEPDTARLMWQHWGHPWTEFPLTSEEEADVLQFAQCFCFGG